MEWCTKFSAKAVRISTLGKQLDLLERDSRASTTAVADHLKSGHTLSSSSILTREEDRFKSRFREAIDIFCRAPKSRSNETFCHVIHSIHHVTKRPNPSLDKYSAMESKDCV